MSDCYEIGQDRQTPYRTILKSLESEALVSNHCIMELQDDFVGVPQLMTKYNAKVRPGSALSKEEVMSTPGDNSSANSSCSSINIKNINIHDHRLSWSIQPDSDSLTVPYSRRESVMNRASSSEASEQRFNAVESVPETDFYDEMKITVDSEELKKALVKQMKYLKELKVFFDVNIKIMTAEEVKCPDLKARLAARGFNLSRPHLCSNSTHGPQVTTHDCNPEAVESNSHSHSSCISQRSFGAINGQADCDEARVGLPLKGALGHGISQRKKHTAKLRKGQCNHMQVTASHPSMPHDGKQQCSAKPNKPKRAHLLPCRKARRKVSKIATYA
eukprot:1780680-Amphidinium_carterae.2